MFSLVGQLQIITHLVHSIRLELLKIIIITHQPIIINRRLLNKQLNKIVHLTLTFPILELLETLAIITILQVNR
jgi:hypothetical protein